MTDLVARLVAAIQQVRTSTPRECDFNCAVRRIESTSEHIPWSHSVACNERHGARVDARLAACVEAMLESVHYTWHLNTGEDFSDTATREGLAAFLAAAAQKETTK